MLFDFNAIEPTITREYILSKYTEEQLYRFYFPDFKLGDVHSPFRMDLHPSFGFFESTRKGFTIIWKDSKTNESGHVFHFIERLLKKQGFTGNSKECLERIYNDLKDKKFPVIESSNKPKSKQSKTNGKRKTVKIRIVETVERDIPEVFFPLWEDIGITRNILDAYHTGFAVEVWLEINVDGESKTILWGRSTEDNPIFYYYFPKTEHFKCYRPLEKDKKRKWISNVTNEDDIQGFEQCHFEQRRIRVLILTKSMKDVMFLRSFGFDSIALHGERHLIDAGLINYLKSRCDLIISLYDNDFAGIRGAILLRDEFGIPLHFIPTYYKAKDPTDLYKLDKRTCLFLVDILNEIIKNYECSNKHTGSCTGTVSRLHTGCEIKSA